MVPWKSTFTVLGLLALTVLAAGCSLCPKGRWFDPKMVAPCPEANPKAQYFLGIEWPWCTASYNGPLHSAETLSYPVPSPPSAGERGQEPYFVAADRFIENLLAPTGRHEIARGVSPWLGPHQEVEPQRGGMNGAWQLRISLVAHTAGSSPNVASAATLMSPRWGSPSNGASFQGLTPLAIACRPFGAKTCGHRSLTAATLNSASFGVKAESAPNHANQVLREADEFLRTHTYASANPFQLVAFDGLEEVQPRRVPRQPERTDYDAPLAKTRGAASREKGPSPTLTNADSPAARSLDAPATTLGSPSRSPSAPSQIRDEVNSNIPGIEEVIIGRPVVPPTTPTSRLSDGRNDSFQNDSFQNDSFQNDNFQNDSGPNSDIDSDIDSGGEAIDTPPIKAPTYPTQTTAPEMELNAPQEEPRITPEMLRGELQEGEQLYMLDGQVIDGTLHGRGEVILQGPLLDENGVEFDPRLLEGVQVDRVPLEAMPPEAAAGTVVLPNQTLRPGMIAPGPTDEDCLLEGVLPNGVVLDGWQTTMPPVRVETIPESAPLDIQLREAETYYAMAVDADKQLDESAMNMYLDAALSAYRYLESVSPQKKIAKGTARAWEVYHSSLARLIFIADKNGCIDKETGLKLPVNGSYRIVEFEYINFQRTADDFDEWHIVGDYRTDYLLTRHRQPGLGVPMVAVRTQKKGDRFFPERLPFAATAVLRPETEVAVFDATTEAAIPDGTHVEHVVARLELYDPRVSGNIAFRGTEVPLAKDTSAPYAYMLSETRQESKLAGLHPTRNIHEKGLFLMEPHRKGKIPIVFVHGLMSEPYIWATVANEIDGNPDLAARYEIWGFSYPGGMPLLDSAAVLREQLDMAVAEIDPSGFDRDLRNMVLVGHSMGGILSKLQITNSGNTLWEHVAYQPLAGLKTTPEVRDYLYRQFYFQRSPYVGRAIFVGTPHQGSTHMSGIVSKHTAHLVHQDKCLKDAHHQLIHDNPAAFRKEMRHRFPNSLDLACPKSLLLEGIYRLPLPPDVPTHTILGSGWWTVHDGRSDGVVPVSSARLPGVQTEVMVTTKHTGLIRDAGGVCEILRILRVHGTRPAFAG